MKSRHTFSLLAGIALSASAFAASAQAADVSMPASDLWNGFYLGAQAGYLQGTGSNSDLCVSASGLGHECLSSQPNTPFDLNDSNMDGVTAGGYLGYNYQMDSIVLGLEGDFNWDNANDSNSLYAGIPLNYETSLNWDASIRARIGFVVDERALLYVTGGPSWINAQLDTNLCKFESGILSGCGDQSTEFGWQLGAGAEYMITDHLSVKAEYLHGWYGDAELNLAKQDLEGTTEKIYLKQDLQTNVVRAGIAYHFGGL